MVGVITLLFVIVLSLLVTKVGAVALAVTGLSPDAAKFQARSAFSGTGFASREAEGTVDHPVRRRIISSLMLWGNAGLASVVATTLITFGGTSGTADALSRTLAVFAGVAVLFVVARSDQVDQWLTVVIRRFLKRVTMLDVSDFAGLLHVREGFAIAELRVKDGDWMVGRQLRELNLPAEGVLILGIDRRDGTWDGAPGGLDTLRAGDMAVLYGPGERLSGLEQRRKDAAGQHEHLMAMDAMREEASPASDPDPYQGTA